MIQTRTINSSTIVVEVFDDADPDSILGVFVGDPAGFARIVEALGAALLNALRPTMEQTLSTRLLREWREQNPAGNTAVEIVSVAFSPGLAVSMARELAAAGAQALVERLEL